MSSKAKEADTQSVPEQRPYTAMIAANESFFQPMNDDSPTKSSSSTSSMDVNASSTRGSTPSASSQPMERNSQATTSSGGIGTSNTTSTQTPDSVFFQAPDTYINGVGCLFSATSKKSKGPQPARAKTEPIVSSSKRIPALARRNTW